MAGKINSEEIADRLVMLIMRDGRERTKQDIFVALRARGITVDTVAITSAVYRLSRMPGIKTTKTANRSITTYQLQKTSAQITQARVLQANMGGVKC